MVKELFILTIPNFILYMMEDGKIIVSMEKGNIIINIKSNLQMIGILIGRKYKVII